MKKIISIIFIAFACILFTTCASVNTQGIRYFVNKPETDLIKHFGYNGLEINNSNEEYDKVVFFTNKVLKYRVSKINYVRYKVSKQTEIINIMFNQFSDGCLCELDRVYYGQHYISDSYNNVTHRNNNASLRPIVNNFNNLVNRNDSFPTSQSSGVFDRSKIGDTYYLYAIDRKQEYNPGVTRIGAGSGTTVIIPSETYTSNIYIAWRVDIVAEDRPETEAYIVGQYYERQNTYYSGNGSSVITIEILNNTINDYRNKGFNLNIITEGNSMYAYIKNGKIIKVEEKTDER